MTDKRAITETDSNIALEHAALHRDVRQLLLQARQKARHQIDTTVVQAYWGVGCRIVEDEQGGQKRAQYGGRVLQWLSGKLTQEFGSGYDVTNLRSMRRFYLAFPIRDTLSLELGWSSYRLLSRIENPQARDWYAQESAEQGWSVRALDRQIATLYYERLLSTQDQSRALVKNEAAKQIAKDAAPDPRDFIRDPYVLEFLGAPAIPALYEKDLEQGLLDQLQKFLLELGKGFAFVARQKHLRVEGEDCFIDLVFYNYLLKCFVLVDLKVGKLAHQDVGQMDMYVRVFDEQQRQEGDNPTLGLILCSERNAAVAKYSLLADKPQLFASKYQALMPTEAELQAELERDRALLETK